MTPSLPALPQLVASSRGAASLGVEGEDMALCLTPEMGRPFPSCPHTQTRTQNGGIPGSQAFTLGLKSPWALADADGRPQGLLGPIIVLVDSSPSIHLFVTCHLLSTWPPTCLPLGPISLENPD